MSTVLAAVAGYLVGGLPTADWLAGRSGLDLRALGSGNPGANNALRVGGRRLAAWILGVEGAKGLGCAALGAWLAGDQGTALAGIGAILGNILNPYRAFRGGQGLGIAAGVLFYALPVAAITGLLVVVLVTRLVRRTAPAALTGLVAVIAVAATSSTFPWGIDSRRWALVLTAGAAVAIAPKQIARFIRPARPPRRARE